MDSVSTAISCFPNFDFKDCSFSMLRKKNPLMRDVPYESGKDPEIISIFKNICSIAASFQAEVLKKQDLLGCGLFVIQLSHSPSSWICDAMLDMLEIHLHHYKKNGTSNDDTIGLLGALFLLGVRKRPRPVSLSIETFLHDFLNWHIQNDIVRNNPWPATAISLLSTINPLDSLAAKAHDCLRHELAGFLKCDNFQKIALTVIGASPFIKETELKIAINKIYRASEHTSMKSIEELSYLILAASFGRHFYPKESQETIKNVLPKLVHCVYQIWSNYTTNTFNNHVKESTDLCSVFRTDLSRAALALIALHQIGAVNLADCSSIIPLKREEKECALSPLY